MQSVVDGQEHQIILNPAPKADIFSHSDGDVVLEGFATTFVGNVTDANHTSDR